MTPRPILVVDDDAELRHALALRLRAAGYAVRTAGDADAALLAVLEHAPRLVLLDLRLGDQDGGRVLAQLRHLAAAHDVPVICLTASRRRADRLAARVHRAHAYITKPFDPQRLLATIAEAVAAPA